jgi:hypothetical protein
LAATCRRMLQHAAAVQTAELMKLCLHCTVKSMPACMGSCSECRRHHVQCTKQPVYSQRQIVQNAQRCYASGLSQILTSQQQPYSQHHAWWY